MATYSHAVGRTFDGSTLLMDRSRLQFFAKATGQNDPVYTDVDAAAQAGHRDLPVPPTFFMAIGLEAPDPFAWLDELEIDLRSVLHGEQQFIYHKMAYAGDELSTSTELVDAYEKSGGALQFLVTTTRAVDQDDALVVEMVNTTVVRQLDLS